MNAPPLGLPNQIDSLASLLAQKGSVALPSWGVIRVRGSDASFFLQGQLTNDVASLAHGRAMFAGYCSAKGRLLASLMVWRPAPDEYLLACSRDLLAATLKRLSMFVLRAQCKLDDASADWQMVGHFQQVESQSDKMPSMPGRTWDVDGMHGTSLPEAQLGQLRYQRWMQVRATTPSPEAESPASHDERMALTWSLLEVASGVPRITVRTVDAFVPQMINLELLQGVSFRKGCYPGQEVVARSQYRGTLKRRLHLFASIAESHGAAAVNASEGMEMFHASDEAQPVGAIVNVATLGPLTLATVSLKTAIFESDPSGTLRSNGSTTWIRLPLPYPVPNEATD